ncbi:hypothetical protein BU23DRAFT_552787 [Bimuria novae-zelandiae CBS 107.79]|uniref:Rpr2-domain-containing protein n=1 Tax=Bimuria novae-zelandiae CBS 107.79 TaxID=1447943 RepID=A0A6A5VE17_9PLEO|nr:hypothetical protein BU23DRAFT_552787 [Bimuria novae-zelandiae CBS 107.79]
MAADAADARLKFLREAVHQLATSAPTISSNLSAIYIKSVVDTEDNLQQAKKEWDTLQREVCGACGNIMLPGWSSSVFHRARPKTTRKQPPKIATPSNSQTVSVCLRCDRKSVQSLPPRKPRHINPNSKYKKTEDAKATTPLVGESQDKVIKSANATSKQRKKSRKGGLQALLEKNKSQSSGGGLGLDLMDFMQ